MKKTDQGDEHEDLAEDREHRILAARFRSSTLGMLPDVIGVEDLDTLNVLLELTINAFWHAKVMRHAGKDRAAVIQALRATWMFFAGFRTMLKGQLYAPLQDALDGIRALDKALVVPLLIPAKKPLGGRAKDTGSRRVFVDLVVFVVNLLQWHGFTANEARTLVARRLQELGVEPSREAKSKTERGTTSITAGTVKYWCTRARANKDGDIITAYFMNSSTRDVFAPKNKPSPAERERLRRRVLEEMLPFITQLPGARPKKES